MFDTLKLYQDLVEPLGDAAAQKLATALGSIYTDLQQTVTKEDFGELKQAMTRLVEAQDLTGQRLGELAEAQVRTEQRVDTLSARMEELAEAQTRTEQRIDTLAARMEELAEAQGRTEQRLGELAEAQTRTEQRLGELAEAQTRTEQRIDTLSIRMEELAEAQVRTERAVERMAEGMDALRQEVGGLSLTMSYALENDAYRSLPSFLSREHGLRVTERFIRTEIGDEEVNFLAHADREDGTRVLIVGESKARLDERRGGGEQTSQVLSQLRRKVDAAARVHGELPIVPLLVTHYARPAFLKAAEAEGVIVAQSFEL